MCGFSVETAALERRFHWSGRTLAPPTRGARSHDGEMLLASGCVTRVRRGVSTATSQRWHLQRAAGAPPLIIRLCLLLPVSTPYMTIITETTLLTKTAVRHTSVCTFLLFLSGCALLVLQGHLGLTVGMQRVYLQMRWHTKTHKQKHTCAVWLNLCAENLVNPHLFFSSSSNENYWRFYRSVDKAAAHTFFFFFFLCICCLHRAYLWRDLSDAEQWHLAEVCAVSPNLCWWTDICRPEELWVCMGEIRQQQHPAVAAEPAWWSLSAPLCGPRRGIRGVHISDHLKAPKSKCWDAGGVSMQSAALSVCLSVSLRQSHAPSATDWRLSFLICSPHLDMMWNFCAVSAGMKRKWPFLDIQPLPERLVLNVLSCKSVGLCVCHKQRECEHITA